MTNKRTYAHLRDCRKDEADQVACSPPISSNDLEMLKFLYIQVDSADGDNITEQDHPDGYNMLILHPRTKRIHWAYSHDFDFVDEEPTHKYRITAIRPNACGYFVFATCFQEAYTETLRFYDRSEILGIQRVEQ